MPATIDNEVLHIPSSEVQLTAAFMDSALQHIVTAMCAV